MHPWFDAPGYQRCPECNGIGSFLVPTKSELFAAADKMTVAVVCESCKSSGRIPVEVTQ